MPYLKTNTYQPNFLFKQRHLNTIYPSIFRRTKVNYKRERCELPDGDFIDLDWSKVESKKMVMLLHGLEGSSDSSYIKGMIRIFNENGWDGAAMNFRGCSGEPNRLLRTYHSGVTEDLESVLQIIFQNHDYEKIVLAGFSLGGNVVLKYIGEKGIAIDERIKHGIGISVPCDLKGCCLEIHKSHNYIYLNRFLVSLKEKTKTKKAFANQIDIPKVLASKDFYEFDNYFTAPVFGFKDAEDYWEKSSSKQFLNNIAIPSLLISARDDSFLSESCYPFEEAESNPNFYLSAPNYGGHVGFAQLNRAGNYWTDEQAIQFVEQFES